ncbi:MAG: hypothetical protein WDN46_12170 [Methylocella sp.]
MTDTVERIVEPMIIVRDYAGLRAAVAMRRKELGLCQLDVDAITGLQSGYYSKLEAGIRGFGPMSFDCVMVALGLELAVVRRQPHHTTLLYNIHPEVLARRQRQWEGLDRRLKLLSPSSHDTVPTAE